MALPLVALATEEVAVVDGVEWFYTLDSTGNAIVTGGGPDSGSLDVPAALDGYPVTAIGTNAFSSRPDLTSLTLPAGVTNVAWEAFGWCKGLKSVTLPDGLEHIGVEAFRGCESLTELSIPGSVRSIEALAFYFCRGLKSLRFGNGVESIGSMAFYYCHGLTSVDIPDSVTTIHGQAFGSCMGLVSVHLGRGVSYLHSRAFSYATSLPAIQVDSGNPSFVSVDGVVFTKDMKALVECPCGKSGDYVLPEGVETIRTGGVSYCSNLTGFRLSDSLSTIEYGGFFGCDGLISVSFGAALTNIDSDAFSYCHSLTEFRVDAANPAFSALDGVLFDKDRKKLFAFPCGRGGAYTVPGGVEEISDNAFRDCPGLETVAFPEGLKWIRHWAFRGCEKLAAVEFPSTLVSIGDSAFAQCPGLTSVSFGYGVESLDFSVFYLCTNLVSVVLPESVKSIGRYVFDGCASLATLYVPASWKGTDMLAKSGVPEGCEIVYCATETAETPVPVPYRWLEKEAAKILAANGGNYEAAADAVASNGVNRVWECYVAGVNPTDAAKTFAVEVSFDGGEPVVGWDPDLGSERTYVVEGAAALGGEDAWGPVTDDSRFFRVKVMLRGAEGATQ